MGDTHRTYLGSAFVAGVLVTVALTEIYHRYLTSSQKLQIPSDDDNNTVNSKDDDKYDQALLNSVRSGPPAIVDGVEGCIGNTPLLRIKSLSDETGCEILAKAEVSETLTSCS